MSLKRLEVERKIRKYHTSPKEVSGLFKIAERDLADSKANNISYDRKFATAYNAILVLATTLLYCKGYQSWGKGHHHTIFEAMKIILGKNYNELADYFDACRIKRNITDYDAAGMISEKEFNEIFKEAKNFYDFVKRWVKEKYPRYI